MSEVQDEQLNRDRQVYDALTGTVPEGDLLRTLNRTIGFSATAGLVEQLRTGAGSGDSLLSVYGIQRPINGPAELLPGQDASMDYHYPER